MSAIYQLYCREFCDPVLSELYDISRFFFISNLKMETKLNLRGMIHLDQIEDLLSNLVDTVQSQQKEINGLKAMCSDYMSTYAADQKFYAVHSRIEDLEMRLIEVNRRSTSRLEDKE